jgi:uncharacterized membrane protein YgcG
MDRAKRGAGPRGSRAAAIKLISTTAVVLAGLVAVALLGPRPVAAARPTATPFPTITPGRHVYDYGNLLSPSAVSIAESLAAKIEAEGGGRVVVYTADLMAMPDEATLAKAWNVDGLLLTGWDDMGTATMGSTLKGMLSADAAKFIADSSAGMNSLASWATSILARTDGLLVGRHVFDGTGTLDTAGLAHAEASAVALAAKLGAPVYVDIAIGEAGNPHSTAFFNNWANGGNVYGKSLVIALAVDNGQIGGYIDAETDLWDSYDTSSPWTYDSLANEAAPNGEVQAELLRAIDAVHKTLDPAAAAASAAASVRDALTRFFSDRTNQKEGAAGAIVALLAALIFVLDRRRRRREPGYADDESVLVPGPPSDMTPALAALVAAPLDTTRAVTCALLDLAAHGQIAFYREMTPMGPRGGIKVVSAAAQSGRSGHSVLAAAASRPLGPGEQFLLDGLVSAAGKGGSLSPTDFADLRPLFEQTGEQLERIAGQRGWLRLQTRSVSRAWVGVGFALLAAAAAWGVRLQPIAAACEALAGLAILTRAVRMPLPLKTPDGAITSAMVDAYRRTLRRALSGTPGEVPPWLANAEEAALWGYAWGLEGEVQAFVGRSVATAMGGLDSGEGVGATTDLSSLRMMGGLSGLSSSRPVGLDTDAIANTLSGLGGAVVAGHGPEAIE